MLLAIWKSEALQKLKVQLKDSQDHHPSTNLGEWIEMNLNPKAAIHRGWCDTRGKGCRLYFVSFLSMITMFLIKVNTNSYCSLKLSCFSQSHLPYNWNSYFNSIILMLLLAMECLVKSATLKLIWPYIFGNGYCLEYN